MILEFWDAAGDDPGRSTGRSRPDPWKCLDCPAAGKGYFTQGEHWRATQHRVAWTTETGGRIDAANRATTTD